MFGLESLDRGVALPRVQGDEQVATLAAILRGDDNTMAKFLEEPRPAEGRDSVAMQGLRWCRGDEEDLHGQSWERQGNLVVLLSWSSHQRLPPLVIPGAGRPDESFLLKLNYLALLVLKGEDGVGQRLDLDRLLLLLLSLLVRGR